MVDKFDFIHFWSVTLVNTIKTTSFIPPSVINLITLGGMNEVVLIGMVDTSPSDAGLPGFDSRTRELLK
jgi:hypothetical protein